MCENVCAQRETVTKAEVKEVTGGGCRPESAPPLMDQETEPDAGRLGGLSAVGLSGMLFR